MQWKSALITLLVGLSLMGAAMLYIRLKRTRKKSLVEAKEYELIDMKPPQPQDDDDLRILMSLGPQGAKPAFMDNLK